MTRAGEKLYGEWEARLAREAGPAAHRHVAIGAVQVILQLAVAITALFGFG